MRSTLSGPSDSARATDCSMSQPPGTQSVAEMRTNRGYPSGQTRRTAVTTSRRRRVRFSKRAAVGIGSLIRERREEFVEQVAVRGMNFDYFESGLEGAGGGSGEIFDDFLNSGAIERDGLCVGVGKGDGAGGHGRPAALGFGDEAAALPRAGSAGFASGVGELNSGDGSLPEQKLR